MKRIATLVAAIALLTSAAFGQITQAQAGRYGLSAWAITGQRTASAFNYDLDSLFGGNAVGGGTYTFPINVCTQALAFGSRNVNPFAANASIRIIDITSANSETVTPAATPVTYNGSTCTINFSPANTHSSFHLRSGTCGLREALNDMGGGGGVAVVDQKFYDDGCSSLTINGLALSGGLLANQYIEDISNGNAGTWYGIKPTALTLLVAPAVPTTGTVAGGTFTNGNVIACTTYVDPLGGETLCTNETTQATGGTTNGLTVASPAASAGAVGYRVYLTAVGGSTGTEIVYTPTSTNCTLTVLEGVIPACAIGSNFSVLAPVTSTSKIPAFGTAHSALGYIAYSGFPPELFMGGANAGITQNFFGPFAAVATITAASAADVAQFYISPGSLNDLGDIVDVCFKANSTNVATAIPTWKLNVATAFGQSPVTLSTVVIPTQTGAVTTGGCFTLATAATGASGTFWSSTPFGPFTETINSTGVSVTAGEVTSAVSSAVDLTKGLYFTINLGATTANITGVTVNQLQVRPASGS